MCLVFVAVRQSRECPLLVAFNRDEVYCRTTRAAHWWEDSPHLLGGRDLERSGTWAGITRSGRIAMLTFVRTAQSGSGARSRRSRGGIVTEFLLGCEPAPQFLARLRTAGETYLPFNIILGDVTGELQHYSNVVDQVTVLGPGVHGLSNATLNTPWPKVRRGCGVIAEYLVRGDTDTATLFTLMEERTRFADAELPSTGGPLERERAVSALFVDDDDYGTRTTTIIRVSVERVVTLRERTHPTPGDEPGEVTFTWTIGG